MTDDTDRRRAFAFPQVSARQMLTILCELVEADENGTAAAEPHVEITTNGGLARLYLPTHRSVPHLAERLVLRVRNLIVLAYARNAEIMDTGPESEQGTNYDFGPFLSLAPAAAALAALNTDRSEDRLEKGGADHLVLLTGSVEDQTRATAEIVRRGRDPRLFRTIYGPPDGRAVLVQCNDEAELLGFVDVAAGSSSAFANILASAQARGFRLWLDVGERVPDSDAVGLFARILSGLQSRGALDASVKDIAVLLPGEDRPHRKSPAILAVHDLDAALPAADTFPERPPFQPVRFTVHALKPDAEAMNDLNRQILAMDRSEAPLGYRMALEPLRKGIAPDMDLEPLREQIDDIETRMAQARALAYPQKRLLRFRHDQFAAMIEALRRLTPGVLNGSSLQYASSETIDPQSPVHFLLYDPSETAIFFPEVQWASITSPHPMAYWMEPFVSEAQATRPSRASVFVPNGTFLKPSLAHFGGSIDDTIRIALGNQFDRAKPILDNPQAEPVFIYSPSDEPGLELVAEVLDGALFAPIRAQLAWLNDHIDVREPTSATPETLRQVARSLYSQGAARDLEATADDMLAAVQRTWREEVGGVRRTAEDLVAELAQELDATSDRMRLGYDFLQSAGKRMKDLETMIFEVEEIVRNGGALSGALAAHDEEMVRLRQLFSDRVRAESALATSGMDRAEALITRMLERLEQIQEWRYR